MITLRTILVGLGVPEEAPIAERAFPHLTQDSREVQPGSLFVARRGEAADGHAFIADAVQRGAAGVLAERPVEAGARLHIIDLRQGVLAAPAQQIAEDAVVFVLTPDSQAALEAIAAWWRSQMAVDVIGVTGSVGKTSTKELVAGVLSRRFTVLKSERSLNTDVGMALTLLQITAEHEKAVLEMGMYKRGEIAHLAALARPRIGLVTNVGPTHLERLGSIEDIALAKRELVEALPAHGVAILNRDDPRVLAMAQHTAARVVTCGTTPEADLWASDVESQGLEGIAFVLHSATETVHVKAPLLGRHSVQTALMAAATGLALDMGWDDVLAGLSVAPEQLRLIVVEGLHGARIIDDTYNSSPTSCLAALNLLAELDGRRIAVLGDMLELGAYEDEGHRLVGRRVAEVAQVLVAVGARGRIIGEEALGANMPGGAVHIVDNNAQATHVLRGLLQQGDVVLIKGSRGMTMEEIVQGLR